MKTFPTLYKRTKTGAIQEWTVWSNIDTVYTEWGQQNGAKQTSSTVAISTNEGKANERNVEEQAEFDAGSLWRNKVDKGYVEDPNDAKEQIVFLPMLAHTLKDKTKLPNGYVFIQPKLDGVRCLAYLEDGEVQLMSRGGKLYNVPHIAAELNDVLDGFTVLDGELYIEGKSCQDITSYVKKYKTGSEKLVLRVFDVINTAKPSESFAMRLAYMNRWFDNFDPITVKQVETIYVEASGLDAHHIKFISDGLEGTIIRLPEGVYEWGARSRDLLKYKSFDDASFKVVAVRAGVGKLSKAAIFTCQNDLTSANFDVIFAGTIEQREEQLTNANAYIGKLLTIKYFGRTNDGLPRFPVGKLFRDAKDEPS